MRNLKLWTMLALAVAVHAGSTRNAHAIPVNIDFNGPSQAFVGITSAFGTMSAFGSGQAFNAKSGKVEPFSLTPPNIHPLTLAGGFALVNSQPDSIGTALFDITPGAITSMSNVDVDLLNGTKVPIVFSQITLTSNSAIPILQKITVDAAGDASKINFFQTGAATLVPLGPGIGTYSIPGDFDVQVTNFTATLFGILPFNLGSLSTIVPSALTGTYTITGPPNSAKLTLDGTLGLQVPVNVADSFVLNLTNPLSLTVSASAAAIATVFINVGYHLEQDQLVVPEPGSIALLGIGVAMCGAVVWRRRRSR
jgi:hypothetical protein